MIHKLEILGDIGKATPANHDSSDVATRLL